MHTDIFAALVDITTTKKDNVWSVELPEMTRPVYDDFKRFLNRCQGKWNRKEKTHTFDYDPQPLFKEVIATGKLPEPNPHSFFPTPLNIALEILETADLPLPRSVLDPSAGSGNLLKAFQTWADNKCQRYDDWGFDYQPPGIQAIELDPINCGKLSAHGLPFQQANFLEMLPTEDYDLVFMNPPFENLNWQKHIIHATLFLKPKGYLLAIVPAKFYTPGDFMNKLMPGLHETYLLPKQETGFPIDTVVIKWEKPKTEEDTQRSPCYGYSSQYVYDCCLYLDNDSMWSQLPPAKKKKELDTHLARLVRDLQVPLMYDTKVKEQLITCLDYGLV